MVALRVWVIKIMAQMSGPARARVRPNTRRENRNTLRTSVGVGVCVCRRVVDSKCAFFARPAGR